MLAYLSLYRWTDQGVKDVKNAVRRVEQATNAIQQAGGRVLAVYWLEGRYDLMSLTEWPDEDTAVAAQLANGMAGNVHSETLRAFSAEEMTRILQRLP
jgi:uncharacterized protein with GYD domain